jgi:hypothetical protein
MKRTALCAIGLSLVLLVGGPAAARDKFDGNWSLYIFGDPGVCEFGYRVPVKIDSRLVTYNGRTLAPAMVAISDSGSVMIRLESSSYVVTGNGAIGGARGAGKWAAPAFHCTGRWRAERQ